MTKCDQVRRKRDRRRGMSFSKQYAALSRATDILILRVALDRGKSTPETIAAFNRLRRNRYDLE